MLKTFLSKLHDFRYFMIAHTYVFFVNKSSYYQIRIKVTIYQLWLLTMNCGKESSQSYLAGMLQLKFYNIFTMFFPLFSKDFTDILRINYLKYIIKCLIIVKRPILYSSFIWLLIYTPINFIENVPYGKKDFFDTKF